MAINFISAHVNSRNKVHAMDVVEKAFETEILNNATVKDEYPMPNIDYMIYRLSQLEIAMTFDLVEGYNQVSEAH